MSADAEHTSEFVRRFILPLTAGRGRRRAMKTQKTLDRRSFIKVSALAGGGMIIGLYTRPEALAQQRGGPAANTKANTYTTVPADNTFTIVANNPDTCQVIPNALPQNTAEQLEEA